MTSSCSTLIFENGWYWASLSINRVHPPPPNCSSASEISWNAKRCHLNITKHRPWAYILGFIELPYFGSEQFRQMYLVERIRICICIWIDVFVFVFVFESKLKKIFVFVFVFEKSKFLYLYLYLYLIKRIWPQPWWLSRQSQLKIFPKILDVKHIVSKAHFWHCNE